MFEKARIVYRIEATWKLLLFWPFVEVFSLIKRFSWAPRTRGIPGWRASMVFNAIRLLALSVTPVCVVLNLLETKPLVFPLAYVLGTLTYTNLFFNIDKNLWVAVLVTRMALIGYMVGAVLSLVL